MKGTRVSWARCTHRLCFIQKKKGFKTEANGLAMDTGSYSVRWQQLKTNAATHNYGYWQIQPSLAAKANAAAYASELGKLAENCSVQ